MSLPRISAQSTVLHRPVPEFCLKDLERNQIIVWDEEKKAFVNVNINEVDFDQAGGIDAIRIFGAQGNGTQDTFNIPWRTDNPDSLIITIQGIKQQSDAYTIVSNAVSTIVTFAEPIENGLEMEIIGLIVEDESSIKSARFVADGSRFQYVLPWAAPGQESLIITLDGVKQQTDAYNVSVSGTQSTLTFTGIPDAGESIEIIGITGTFGSSMFGLEDAEGSNLGINPVHTIYDSTTTIGSTATLNFKSLVPGPGITLTSNQSDVTIEKTKLNVRRELVTDYTLNLGDEMLLMESSAPVTVRIPLDSVTDFETGSEIEIVQYGNGLVSIAPEAGVSVIANNNIMVTAGLATQLRLIKVRNNEWLLLRG